MNKADTPSKRTQTLQAITTLALAVFCILIGLGSLTHSEGLAWLEIIQIVIAPFEALALGIAWALHFNAQRLSHKGKNKKGASRLKVLKWASNTCIALGAMLLITFAVHHGPNGASLLGTDKSYTDMQAGCTFLVVAILLSIIYRFFNKRTGPQ